MVEPAFPEPPDVASLDETTIFIPLSGFLTAVLPLGDQAWVIGHDQEALLSRTLGDVPAQRGNQPSERSPIPTGRVDRRLRDAKPFDFPVIDQNRDTNSATVQS